MKIETFSITCVCVFKHFRTSFFELLEKYLRVNHIIRNINCALDFLTRTGRKIYLSNVITHSINDLITDIAYRRYFNIIVDSY